MIEYAKRGDGPALLLSHVTSGGFGNGIGIANPYVGEAFRFVLPSRPCGIPTEALPESWSGRFTA
jgi:hypothetical protein